MYYTKVPFAAIFCCCCSQFEQFVPCFNGAVRFSANFLHVTFTALYVVFKEREREWNRKFVYNKNNCAFVYLHLTELKLITRPVTTTTPTPYVYTTAKPRRKQNHNHNHKGHDTSNRVKEILLPNNLQENEIVGVAAADSNIEGMYPMTEHIIIKTISRMKAPIVFLNTKNNAHTQQAIERTGEKPQSKSEWHSLLSVVCLISFQAKF